MREPLVFDVRCKGCGHRLVTVERLRDPGIAILEDHLRACAASERLGEAPMLGEIMRGLNVAVLKG